MSAALQILGSAVAVGCVFIVFPILLGRMTPAYKPRFTPEEIARMKAEAEARAAYEARRLIAEKAYLAALAGLLAQGLLVECAHERALEAGRLAANYFVRYIETKS